MSILISPSDNRGWGAGIRRRSRSSMRGVGVVARRPLTLRGLLGLGVRRTRRRRYSRRIMVVVPEFFLLTTTRLVGRSDCRRRRR
uniref:PVII protein n=1 Tax=Northern Aplomado falcon adenovirus TaxID=415853 RepID=Q4KWL0_9ADEN|nr:pVII protein [Northern Aplomado falcon adenovirus]